MVKLRAEKMLNRDEIITEIRERGGVSAKPAQLPTAVRVPKLAHLPPEDLLTDTVLFGCIANAEYLTDAVARLQDDDWPLDWQRRVWAAIKRLIAQRMPVNVVTLDPLLMEGADFDLLLRASCATANPYQADYVGALAALGKAERERAEALATVTRGLQAG